MKLIKTIFILLIIIIGITFAILNAKTVPLHYYFGATDISLALLLAMTLIVGASLGWLLSIPATFRLKRSNRQMRSRIKLFEKEIDHLRSVSAKELQ